MKKGTRNSVHFGIILQLFGRKIKNTENENVSHFSQHQLLACYNPGGRYAKGSRNSEMMMQSQVVVVSYLIFGFDSYLCITFIFVWFSIFKYSYSCYDKHGHKRVKYAHAKCQIIPLQQASLILCVDKQKHGYTNQPTTIARETQYVCMDVCMGHQNEIKCVLLCATARITMFVFVLTMTSKGANPSADRSRWKNNTIFAFMETNENAGATVGNLRDWMPFVLLIYIQHDRTHFRLSHWFEIIEDGKSFQ